jgi:broad specificity phosphatase PhoE
MRITAALLLFTLHLAAPARAQAPLAPQGQAPQSSARQLSSADIVNALREGGYVLYFRHTATDHTQNDSRMTSFDDCADQRNLVDKGREDARMIGSSLRALSIPIGRVYTSPHCRTVETAELAFGRGEKLNEVRYSAGTGAEPPHYAELRRLLAAKPARGTNTVIVGHGAPIQTIAGLSLGEGDIEVLWPLDTRFELAARIRVEDWPALNAATGR